METRAVMLQTGMSPAHRQWSVNPLQQRFHGGAETRSRRYLTASRRRSVCGCSPRALFPFLPIERARRNAKPRGAEEEKGLCVDARSLPPQPRSSSLETHSPAWHKSGILFQR
ncbi:hypothetical protein OJAV_G00056270 [Oryzias javanicus]|uniref:Uncharacterized protein n=1 Tax=Oryzias javanicus TaxID=123683 RepID=A0A3S2UIS6_ORYJA|nr:hypothetical protein OJAV_G00056270 [Oryzias javanicus]